MSRNMHTHFINNRTCIVNCMNVLLPVVIVGLTLTFALVAVLITAGEQAEAYTPFPSREKVITVTGTATALVEPDMLVITLGMENQESTARDALEANSAAMEAVVDTVQNIGITEEELSTSRINIYPVYESVKDPFMDRYTQELIGFRVTNTLTVKTAQLDLAADIIDGAISAGANKVDDVSFTLSAQKQIETSDDLLEKAVMNAKVKAEKALAPLGHHITGVKSVNLSESWMSSPQQLYGMEMMYADSTSFKSSTPIFFSDLDVSTSANVIFLIGSN